MTKGSEPKKQVSNEATSKLIISTKEARKLLGKDAKSLSDDEIETVIITLTSIAASFLRVTNLTHMHPLVTLGSSDEGVPVIGDEREDVVRRKPAIHDQHEFEPGSFSSSKARRFSKAARSGATSAAPLTFTWHQMGIARPAQFDTASTAIQNEPNWLWSREQYQ